MVAKIPKQREVHELVRRPNKPSQTPPIPNNRRCNLEIPKTYGSIYDGTETSSDQGRQENVQTTVKVIQKRSNEHELRHKSKEVDDLIKSI